MALAIGAPGFAWTADVTPEFVIRLVVTPANKIIARRFRGFGKYGQSETQNRHSRESGNQP